MKLVLSFLLLALPAFAADQTIPARFAYYDASHKVLQIVGEPGALGLAGACTASGADCSCEILAPAAAQKPAPRKVIARSLENGSVTCAMPAAPAAGAYAQMKSVDRGASTLLPIKTSLTLADATNGAKVEDVNKILKYTCEKTFFEGEGVTMNSITCDTSSLGVAQHLGLIRASYDYYVYANDKEGVHSPLFTASFYPGICNRQENEFTRASCSASAELRYGLLDHSAGQFQVRVQLTRAPEQDSRNEALTQSVGFAALPDSAGNCPVGLLPIRPYQARPASITPGSIDGHNPASNFVNQGDGFLYNTVVEAKAPANFKVVRRASNMPCQMGGATPGSCVGATFGAPQTVQSVGYTALTPVICAIPASLLQ